jgi:hypothetical protein
LATVGVAVDQQRQWRNPRSSVAGSHVASCCVTERLDELAPNVRSGAFADRDFKRSRHVFCRGAKDEK